MEKTEFFRLWGARDSLDMHVFDYWSDKREEQNLPWDCEDLDFNYSVNYRDKTISIQTNHGKETYPLSGFYDEIKEEEPQMLWHCGYYDGPINGIARYKGNIVWFDCIEWEYDNLFHTRVYELYELSDMQIKDEIYHHNRFRAQVGRHCDYCDDFWNPAEFTWLKIAWNTCYKWNEKQSKADYTKNKVVGTFDDIQFNKQRDRWTYQEAQNK